MASTTSGRITLTLTADQAYGLLGAAQYWSAAEGGDNFGSGYQRDADGAEERRIARHARDAIEKLDEKMSAFEQTGTGHG